MFSITLKRSLTTLAVMAGLLAAAGPASAGTGIGLKADSNQVAVESCMDYTDDVAFAGSGRRAHRDDALVFSGDAYDNEMGITA
jgi:hypothetical protein